jgi:hypothetical protein
MEFGPRALGNRSILGDPRRSDMQAKLNLKIKFRESFRPFAPAILEERVSDCFELSEPSPYMLLVAPVQEALRTGDSGEQPSGIMARLKQRRSTLPAVTHVDYSARIQTVSLQSNPAFHRLLSAFEMRTGCPVLVNTSFNVRGEPPVCTPEEGFRCFMKTEMDYLVLGNLLIDKTAIAGKAADSAATAVCKPPLVDASGTHNDESRSTLRRFGLTIGIAFFVLGSVLDFRHRAAGRPFQSLAILLLLLAGFAPTLLRFVYRPWMRLAHFLGAISSAILLTLLFFFVVTPVGWMQRLFGKRALDLRFHGSETSYWQRRTTSSGSADYDKQF